MARVTEKVTRMLKAIFSADVKGYSLLMADDEVHTIETLKKYRQVMFDLITQHSGRVVDNPGDNLLAEFSSAVDAVEAAVQIQKRLNKENAKFVEDKRLEFRIGVNIGDVVKDGDRIYGEGVNVAARIESLTNAGGIYISRNTYDHVKSKLNYGFEYLGEHEVKNIKEPVRVYKVIIDTDVPKPLIEEELELPDKPSIAVLPFTNMSGDQSQEYFSDGLTEQIINGLCKVSNLFVIARNSSFAYKGKAISVKKVAKELGVRYILEGSVQRAENRVRITAQLIDATTDYHMWSDTYDRDLEDIFALQDEITMNLINAMEVNLTFGEQALLWKARKTNIKAYENMMKGQECVYRCNQKDIAQARRYAQAAKSYDKDYGLAYVMEGITHQFDIIYGWSESTLSSFERLEHCVRKALSVSENLDYAFILSAWVHMIKREFDEAIEDGQKAVEIAPNGADVHVHYGNLLSYTEDTNIKRGIQYIQRAFRLNPIPRSIYYTSLGVAYRNNGQYDRAIELCKKAIEMEPDAFSPYPTLTISLKMTNRDEDANVSAQKMLKIQPDYSVETWILANPFKDESRIDELANALRKAGVPD
jgi:adenylate cyclase